MSLACCRSLDVAQRDREIAKDWWKTLFLRIKLRVQFGVLCRIDSIDDQVLADETEFAFSIAAVLITHLARAGWAIDLYGGAATAFIEAYNFVLVAGLFEVRDVGRSVFEVRSLIAI